MTVKFEADEERTVIEESSDEDEDLPLIELKKRLSGEVEVAVTTITTTTTEQRQDQGQIPGSQITMTLFNEIEGAHGSSDSSSEYGRDPDSGRPPSPSLLSRDTFHTFLLDDEHDPSRISSRPNELHSSTSTISALGSGVGPVKIPSRTKEPNPNISIGLPKTPSRSSYLYSDKMLPCTPVQKFLFSQESIGPTPSPTSPGLPNPLSPHGQIRQMIQPKFRLSFSGKITQSRQNKKSQSCSSENKTSRPRPREKSRAAQVQTSYFRCSFSNIKSPPPVKLQKLQPLFPARRKETSRSRSKSCSQKDIRDYFTSCRKYKTKYKVLKKKYKTVKAELMVSNQKINLQEFKGRNDEFQYSKEDNYKYLSDTLNKMVLNSRQLSNGPCNCRPKVIYVQRKREKDCGCLCFCNDDEGVTDSCFERTDELTLPADSEFPHRPSHDLVQNLMFF